ncbi:receptor-like protein 9DC3 [Lycium barbarum]|uniref:receptor-like protein 9DC3 n=1 Tax=Lycium barbarum TaxID=112863 RepID=UPI00293E866E|nr:receptor-like protein 9DC3 [Lycium barbarum]
MDISRMQAYAQNLEDRKHQWRTECKHDWGHGKRARSLDAVDEFRQGQRQQYFYLTTTSSERTTGDSRIAIITGRGLSYTLEEDPSEDVLYIETYPFDIMCSIETDTPEIQGKSVLQVSSTLMRVEEPGKAPILPIPPLAIAGQGKESQCWELIPNLWIMHIYPGVRSLWSDFFGNLPESLGYLTSLLYLSLRSFNLSGPIAKSLWDLTHRESLRLQNNHLEGPIPLFTSGLKNLRKLWVSNNSVHGSISSWIFSLPSLSSLDLGSNQFSGKLKDFKYNSFIVITLRDYKLQGYLPKSIQNLVNLEKLHLSSKNFTGKLDVSFFSNRKQLSELDFSYNSISLANENKFKSTFPESLTHLALSSCEVDELEFLRSGKQLWDLDLSNNKIQGRIPNWLEVLDLGNNHLNDTFRMWLGILPNLRVLTLRYNKLHGPIITSSSTQFFTELRMLDQSCNAFTAEIQTSLFQNLKAMTRIDQIVKALNNEYYEDSITVVTKGLEHEVVRILSSYTTMDISSNKFDGHIPSMIGDVITLHVLNLSHHRLQGHIPTSLGKLYVVESFDLSFNQLSGEIPKTLASFISLAVLNVSYNHLKGCVPKGLLYFRTIHVKAMMDYMNSQFRETVEVDGDQSQTTQRCTGSRK